EGEQRQVTFEAPDEHTVVMTLPAPSAAFLLQQRFPIMPKHKLLDFSVEGGAAPGDINNAWPTDVDLSEVVGTGPFMYRSYTPGQLVVLERNPNYWKQDAAGTQLPYAEELRFLVVQGTEAQTAQFLAGNLYQLNISGAQFPNFKDLELQGSGFRVVVSDALFGSPPHIAFNFDDPTFGELFSNHEFRKAMEFAVNRERVIEDVYDDVATFAMRSPNHECRKAKEFTLNRERVIEDVYNGHATLPGTPTAPADGTFYEDTTGLMNMFDLEAAAAAHDSLGVVDSDGDGI